MNGSELINGGTSKQWTTTQQQKRTNYWSMRQQRLNLKSIKPDTQGCGKALWVHLGDTLEKAERSTGVELTSLAARRWGGREGTDSKGPQGKFPGWGGGGWESFTSSLYICCGGYISQSSLSALGVSFPICELCLQKLLSTRSLIYKHLTLWEVLLHLSTAIFTWYLPRALSIITRTVSPKPRACTRHTVMGGGGFNRPLYTRTSAF